MEEKIKKHKERYKWDGSCLENLDNQEIKCIWKYKKNNFWLLEHNNIQVLCLVYKGKTHNTLHCIIDELRTIFSLHKIGTHHCYYNKKLHILYNFSNLMLNRNILNNKITRNKYNLVSTEIKRYINKEPCTISELNKEPEVKSKIKLTDTPSLLNLLANLIASLSFSTEII